MTTTPTRRPARTSTSAGLSLAFGLLALALCLIPVLGVIAFPLGFLSVLTALLGLRAIRRYGMAGRGLALAGLVTGGIGLLVAFSLLLTFIQSFRTPEWREDLDEFDEFREPDPR
jgi:hypothetical protein